MRAAEIGGSSDALEGRFVGLVTAIVVVVGRAMGRHAADAQLFARVVRHGGAVVSVHRVEEECELAAQVLDGAGAREVRGEPGPEAR